MVYEIKDKPDELYRGESLHLSYLLALISCSRNPAFSTNEKNYDIWCTGAVEIKGNELPFLKIVEGFDTKLKGFLSEKDSLFIVPAGNISSENNILLKKENIRLLSLEQFQNQNMRFGDLFETKTVLMVHGNGLESLVETIFHRPIVRPLKSFKNADHPERKKSAEIEAPNLLILLEKIKQSLIKGYLEESIYNKLLIELGKEFQPNEVEHPLGKVLELFDRHNQVLSRDKKIIDVYDEAEHFLLILGEPGAGKTTTMLELIRELVIRAEKDYQKPIPVYFNLSTWSESRKPIFDWVIEESIKIYQKISKKFIQPWLENHRLFLFLDGLDEVREESRADCVKAVNAFIEEFGAAGVVVCSRLKEYDALPIRLRLNGAVKLQPLTQEQIDEYLKKAGSELDGLHTQMQQDHDLQELAQSPLMLNIMCMTYKGASADAIISDKSDTIEERRRLLFDRYIDKMFDRRGKKELPYSKEQTIAWLSWLAKGMKRHSQNIFLIENLQPSWLSTPWQCFYILASRMMITLIFPVGFISGIGIGIIDILKFASGDRFLKVKKFLNLHKAIDCLIY